MNRFFRLIAVTFATVTVLYVIAALTVTLVGFGGMPTRTTAGIRLLSSPIAFAHERVFGPYHYSDPDIQALTAHGFTLADVTEGAHLEFRRPGGNRPPLAVLEVSGDPYLMGFQQGYLLREEVRDNVERLMLRTRSLLFYPEQLDAVYAAFEPYLADEDKTELEGLADGSGVPIELIRQMHAIPEVTEHFCSGYALLKGATADGHSYHVRILDWGTITGMEANPAVIIYRPEHARTFVNFTWPGYIGALGGFNGKVALGEIAGGGTNAEEAEIWQGLPFSFLFREILRNSADLEDVIGRIREAKRTKKYAFVVSDQRHAAVLKTGPKKFLVAYAGQSGPEAWGKRAHYPGFADVAYYSVRHERVVTALEHDHTRWSLAKIIEENKAFGLSRDHFLDIEESMHAWICSHDRLECLVANESPFHAGSAVDQPYVRIDLRPYYPEP